MGTVASIKALRPNLAPSRAALVRRLSEWEAPARPVSSEFVHDLSGGVWRLLLDVFSGGEYGRMESRFIDGAEGVWAVRGRHPLVPPGGEVSLYYNDADDVAAIAAWLASSPGPLREVAARFREGYERDHAALVAQGASEAAIKADIGSREEARWERQGAWLVEFYERAAAEGLWVECYIR